MLKYTLRRMKMKTQHTKTYRIQLKECLECLECTVKNAYIKRKNFLYQWFNLLPLGEKKNRKRIAN
jgi:nitrate reductase beta subunit